MDIIDEARAMIDPQCSVSYRPASEVIRDLAEEVERLRAALDSLHARIDVAAASVSGLEAELAAARELLAQATEFRVGEWRIRQFVGAWFAYIKHYEDLKEDEELGPFGTAAEAVAAAEKARDA
jgi:hypothetical protein